MEHWLNLSLPTKVVRTTSEGGGGDWDVPCNLITENRFLNGKFSDLVISFRSNFVSSLRSLHWVLTFETTKRSVRWEMGMTINRIPTFISFSHANRNSERSDNLCLRVYSPWTCSNSAKSAQLQNVFYEQIQEFPAHNDWHGLTFSWHEITLFIQKKDTLTVLKGKIPTSNS